MATRKPTGRFGDEKGVQRNKDNSPDPYDKPNRSPGQSNANRARPSLLEDVGESQSRDTKRIGKAMFPTGKGAARTAQQEAGARLEKETMDKLETIGNKIDKFSEKYCKLHNIDILMIHAKGGQFNYINPKMNVTKEFTAFLNQNQEQIEKEMGKK